MKDDDHSRMRAALQAELVPLLRQRGFTGSLPHFRRIAEPTIALLTIQFNKYGGAFLIELGRTPRSEWAPSPGKLIPPDELSAWDMPFDQRPRLHPTPGNSDEWFSYRTPRSNAAGDPDRFTALARAAAALLAQADAWWAGGSNLPNIPEAKRERAGR